MIRIRKFIKKPRNWPAVSIALSVGVLLVLTSILSVFAANPNLPCDVGASEAVPPDTCTIIDMYAADMGEDQYPEDLNLWNPVLEISGALWDYFPSDQASGTGVFNTYLAVKAPGSSLVERGYNTGVEKKDHVAYYNEDDAKTSVLPLSKVPVVDIEGTLYREFACDINEVSGLPDQLISLEVLQIWQTDEINIGDGTNLYSDPMSPDYEFSSLASLVYDLDCEDNYTLILDYGVNTGSGKPDYKVFIPNDWFDNSIENVIMLVVHGNLEEQNPSSKKDPNEYYGTGSSSGFEEWGVRIVEPTCGEVSITKEDSPDEVGCPGETITYTLTVANAGPGTATGIYLEDTLPTNMALTDVKLNGGSTGDYDISAGVLRYPATGGVSLDDGESFTLTIEGTATDCDPLENSATVYADNDCSEEGNTDSTTTERNIPAVDLNVPEDYNGETCMSQEDIDDDFADWLAAGNFTGGCDGVLSYGDPTAPDRCGGYVDVTWNVTSTCEDPVTATRRFTIPDAPAVDLNVPEDYNGETCMSQEDIDDDFADWLAAGNFTGGCDGVLSYGDPTAPDRCGGYVDVTWNVTSTCEDPVTATRRFTIPDAPELNVTCPDDYVGAYGVSCSTDPEITGSPIVSGGCDPQVTFEDDIVPGDTCGWTVTRTWNITDLCESYTCVQHISCTCPTCETAVAAQGPGPGQIRFPFANSWFTYIKYYTGTGHNSPGTAQEFPIFAGKTQLVGTLYVYDFGGTLYVKYSNTGAEPGCTVFFSEYHLQVDDEYNDFRSTILRHRNPVPGKCEYKGSLPNVPETDWMADDISGYGNSDVYIFAHSVACYYCAP